MADHISSIQGRSDHTPACRSAHGTSDTEPKTCVVSSLPSFSRRRFARNRVCAQHPIRGLHHSFHTQLASPDISCEGGPEYAACRASWCLYGHAFSTSPFYNLGSESKTSLCSSSLPHESIPESSIVDLRRPDQQAETLLRNSGIYVRITSLAPSLSNTIYPSMYPSRSADPAASSRSSCRTSGKVFPDLSCVDYVINRENRSSGWSLGMRRAGYTVIAACEIDPWRRAVLEQNHP